MQAKVTRFTVLCILFLSLLLTSCSPKIYGVRKHRKDRNCGCEYVTPENKSKTNIQL